MKLELTDGWEEIPEGPKEYWYIEPDSSIIQNHKPTYINHLLDGLKSIGNYFETEEEAEKAVEKLRAWKRLKDKGFRFDGKEVFSEGLLEIDGVLPALKGADNAERLKIIDDLDLIFGGEE